MFNEAGASFSPDGRCLAFVSDESGRNEIYVQPFAGLGPKRKVSVGGGVEPVWSKAGNRLFYRQQESMLTVDVSPHPPLAFSAPRTLFEGSFSRSSVYVANYDVVDDGLWFLMIQEDSEDAPPNDFRVILDWSVKLKRDIDT